MATGRHPWRPAHIHMIVRADGYRPLTTHVFDRASEYLESDAVFAVKPSLVRDFVRRDAGRSGAPAGIDGEWFSVRNDLVLAPERASAPLKVVGQVGARDGARGAATCAATAAASASVSRSAGAFARDPVLRPPRQQAGEERVTGADGVDHAHRLHRDAALARGRVDRDRRRPVGDHHRRADRARAAACAAARRLDQWIEHAQVLDAALDDVGVRTKRRTAAGYRPGSAIALGRQLGSSTTVAVGGACASSPSSVEAVGCDDQRQAAGRDRGGIGQRDRARRRRGESCAAEVPSRWNL